MARKKEYIIRLYRAHDLDLITFVMCRQFNIVKAVYSCLKAFSKGEAFMIELPPARSELPALGRIYQRILYLDTDKDAEIIALLDKISRGYRNNFMKNLLRLYLGCPASDSFMAQGVDADEFFRMFDIFRKDRRVVRAGKLKEKTPEEELLRRRAREIGERQDQLEETIKRNAETHERNERKNNDEINGNKIVPEKYADLMGGPGNHAERNTGSGRDEGTFPSDADPEGSPADADESLDDELTDIFSGLM